MIKSVLIDQRNADDLIPIVAEKIANVDFIGFDIETQDENAHEGIKAYRKSDTAKVFDYHRTIVTGFSVYAEGDDTAYYVNLNHADVENRVDWEVARVLLDSKKPGAYFIAHNAPFELTNMRLALGYRISEIICTMQMAVSAYGPDDYSEKSFREADLGAMAVHAGAISKAFWDYQKGQSFTSEQGELFGKIAGKETKAAHSYNGWVRDLAFGYGLKKAVKSHFGHRMTTFEEALQGKAHMGQLTGEEVCAYGADDAYWAVRLFRHLLTMLAAQNDQLVNTFFTQENPMIHVFSDIACEGMAMNVEAVLQRRADERSAYATGVRALKARIKACLPFPTEMNETLARKDKWYRENGARYRASIEAWANSADCADDLEECQLVRGAVTNAWTDETGGNSKKLIGPNLSHYMPMRTILYDLLGAKFFYDMGKVQSDGEARGKMIDHFKTQLRDNEDAEEVERINRCIAVIEGINKLASIEQAMKLYLTPYSQLMDPDTGRMYPSVSSLLATRRMGASVPNPMQLAKHTESAYIRSYYKADENDHLLVSLDWSQIELVFIGEYSGDPEFRKAFGQLPYEDLHKAAAADLLSLMYDTPITPDQFASLRMMDDDVREPFGFPLVDVNGNLLTPVKAYKYNRGTAGGKGMNFGYWYSGALGSVANARGLPSELMWKLTDAYRQRFAVAEEWRLMTIQTVQDHGFVTLPDGHRRNRFEATMPWQIRMNQMWRAFGTEGCKKFGEILTSKLARRAGNQAVNAMIQGSCAMLAKRTIIRLRQRIDELGLRATFKMPIHDEVLFSVHKDDLFDFIKLAKVVMTDHPDVFPTLKLNCTAAIGRNFGAYDPVKNPYGQIELDEAPKGLPCIDPRYIDKILPDDQIDAVIDYLSRGRVALAA